MLDIEQSLLLLELEPPFDKRDVQLARRRLAKVWHPDLAPPGQQLEHERHLKAINEAADQLERIAEDSRGGKVTRNAVKVSAAAARKARAEEGRRAYEAEQRRARTPRPIARSTTRSARACPITRSSTATRAASPTPSGAWATVNGIYFTGGGDDIQQWARVRFQPGVRTVPAGSLQFVDFSKPDPGAERVERFMTAAQHALAEGDFALAARAARLRARRRAAQPGGAAADDARVLAGGRPAGRRAAPCATGRASRATARRRTASPRASTRTWARSRWPTRPPCAPSARAPQDADAWERVGRLRLRLHSTARARARRSSARAGSGPSVEGLLDLALVLHLARRRRRRGHRLRAGDAARAASRRRVGALRARAGAHRPRRRRDRGLRARARRWTRRRRGPRAARAAPRPGPARPACRLKRQSIICPAGASRPASGSGHHRR